MSSKWSASGLPLISGPALIGARLDSDFVAMIGARQTDDPLDVQGEFQWDHIALSCPRLQEGEEVLQLREVLVWSIGEMLPVRVGQCSLEAAQHRALAQR